MIFSVKELDKRSALAVSDVFSSIGFPEKDMEEIADIIYLTLKDFEGNKKVCEERVKKLLDEYPLY